MALLVNWHRNNEYWLTGTEIMTLVVNWHKNIDTSG